MKKSALLVLSVLLLTSLAFTFPAAVFATDAGTAMTEEELTLIASSKTEPVTVGVVDNSAPVSYKNDKSGKYEGIDIDMLQAVSEKTGLVFTYVDIDITRRSDATNPTAESPRLVVGVTYSATLPDERGWLLSDALHSDELMVVSRRGNDLGDPDIRKTVAVMSEFGMALEFVQQRMPEYTIVRYETLADCLDAVASGETDTAVYLRSCINYLLQRPRYDQLSAVPAYSEAIDSCVAGFTSDAALLISIINKGLAMVTETESHSIALNYTILNPYDYTVGDLVYKYRVPIIIIILLIVSVIVSLVTTIIVRRRSGAKVKAALALAEQASTAKGNFMSRMSHEIRTPLNAVIGYNTIARNELTEAKSDSERLRAEMKVMDCLTKSDIASRHLLTIINDVLDMSAIESGKIHVTPEKFDFKGLVASLTVAFYSQAKNKGVDFDVKFDSQMDEWLIGDQLRINQVLSNLLANAVKFTSAGGCVTLTIHPETYEDTVDIRFDVSDTGIGMPSEYLSRLFTPFEQADSSISRRFGGTGLGLSITKTLVDMMDGTIDVKSEPGRGSTFTVCLTLRRTEQPVRNDMYDFSSVNALIVDDDIGTCDYIRLLMSRSGVRSTAVTSGADAVDAVAYAYRSGDPYTVCLVDWRMPDMDGLETVRRIRDVVGASMPIIVISAYDFTEIADHAAEIGVNMFISKPLFQSSLFNMLANISGGRLPINNDAHAVYDFSGARLLLAEDNIMNMEIACRILESAKFDVDSAWNGKEAVDMFESSSPGTYAVILMDVQMPVMDGYTATKQIRRGTHPDATRIPIIAMTADAFAENIAESLASGMNAHISKPIDLNILFGTLAEQINTERPQE